MISALVWHFKLFYCEKGKNLISLVIFRISSELFFLRLERVFPVISAKERGCLYFIWEAGLFAYCKG